MSKSSIAAPAMSIVIPAPGDATALEATLVSVLENRPPNCEIVVALGFAYDDPWRIGDEVRLVAAPGSGLASCANVGIAASAAPVVHVLAAGWRATPGWTDRPLALLAEADVHAVVPAGVASSAPERIVSAGIRVTRGGRRVAVVPSRRSSVADTSRLRPAAPTLEAGFWRAEVLAAVGPGFATCCGDWLADADIAAAIAALPGRVVFASESRVVCGPVSRRPRPFTAGLQAERLFWRSLARGRLLAALAGHGVDIVRDVFATVPLGTLPMLAGRLAALMQFGEFVPRLVRLRALRAAARGPTGRVLRIDAAHAPLARPRQAPMEAGGLRRSA